MRRYRLLAGDERGQIKVISIRREEKEDELRYTCDIESLRFSHMSSPEVWRGGRVQYLDISSHASTSTSQGIQTFLAAWARDDGALCFAELEMQRGENDDVVVLADVELFPWGDAREQWICCHLIQHNGGLAAFAATANGTVIVQPFQQPLLPQPTILQLGQVKGLQCLAFSPSNQKFAYGGLEVDLVVTDLRSFLGQTESSPKRIASGQNKMQEPWEIWRARNVPNDELDLRTPVNHLNVIWSDEKTLFCGQENGDVRKYHLPARRPVTVFPKVTMPNKINRDIGKGYQHYVFTHSQAHGQGTQVKLMESYQEGEDTTGVFFADGKNSLGLFSLDNRLCYVHKGQGAFQAIVRTADLLVTANADRYLRAYALDGKSRGACVIEQALKVNLLCFKYFDVSQTPHDDIWSGLRDAEEPYSEHESAMGETDIPTRSTSISPSKDDDFHKARKAGGKRKRSGRER